MIKINGVGSMCRWELFQSPPQDNRTVLIYTKGDEFHTGYCQQGYYTLDEIPINDVVAWSLLPSASITPKDTGNPPWTEVTSRLPNSNVQVLIFDDNNIHIGHLTDDKHWISKYKIPLQKVLRWLRLPEKPTLIS